MKKVLLIVFMLTGFGITKAQNNAQEPKNPEKIAAHKVERIDRLVLLDQAQKEKLRAIMLKHEESVAKDRQTFVGTQQELSDLRKQRNNDLQKEISAVLTPEQRVKLREHKKEAKEHRRNVPMKQNLKKE